MVSQKETGIYPKETLKQNNHPLDLILKTSEEHVIQNCEFFDRISRPDLKEVVTFNEPWAYITAEFYGAGIKGQGGLGMLAGDTYEVAKKLEIPAIFSTLFYRKERSYVLDELGKQKEVYKGVFPEDKGFSRLKLETPITISTKTHPSIALDVYRKKEGSVSLLAITEPGIGELYQDEPSSDHRLYQNIALGFGGYKALKELGLKPSMNQQLNEAPTVFSALARLDDYLSQMEDKDFKKALAEVKKKTIYTNHTLVQAVEASFNLGQFEYFVLPNIKNEELKQWLTEKIKGKGGHIKLSTLAIELSGKKNGVSKIHAREASREYVDYEGKSVSFESVTNGIAIDRWGAKELLNIYRQNSVLDKYDLPDISKVSSLKEAELRAQKQKQKKELLDYLRQRKDQYGKPIYTEEGAKIMDWRRRIANYKRPGIIFSNPEKFAEILEKENIHFIMAGNVHPADGPMKGKLERILSIINNNEILKKRVHFVQDYDEELGKKLSQGADISLNTPIVGKEACGTSGMKDLLNLVMIISTEDGWLADPAINAKNNNETFYDPSYLQIKGEAKDEVVASIYANILRASQIMDGKVETIWGDFVKRQLRTFLPIVSGARMEKDYLNLGFPFAS